jgi:hypothetical protein
VDKWVSWEEVDGRRSLEREKKKKKREKKIDEVDT